MQTTRKDRRLVRRCAICGAPLIWCGSNQYPFGQFKCKADASHEQRTVGND